MARFPLYLIIFATGPERSVHLSPAMTVLGLRTSFSGVKKELQTLNTTHLLGWKSGETQAKGAAKAHSSSSAAQTPNTTSFLLYFCILLHLVNRQALISVRLVPDVVQCLGNQT
jgi:hypothetical protein